MSISDGGDVQRGCNGHGGKWERKLGRNQEDRENAVISRVSAINTS